MDRVIRFISNNINKYSPLTKAETFTAAIQIMAKIMNSMAAKR
jgi:hypothetical protein